MKDFLDAVVEGWMAFRQNRRMRGHDLFLDLSENRTARRGLRSAERKMGRLPAALRRQCDDYAREVLGSRRYAPWLHVMASVRGRFEDGWIANNYYARHVVPHAKGQYGRIDNLRPLQNRLFATDAFPDVGAFVNGYFHDAEARQIDGEALVPALFGPADSLIFKRDFTGRGRGVHTIPRAGFDPAAFPSLGNGVFQRHLRQHPALAEVMPGSVTTFRLTTVIDRDGRASLRSAFAKFGRAGEAHVQAATGIFVAIDPQTGRMQGSGLMPDWTLEDRHPDTGILYDGRAIPRFAECCALAVELQARLPYARCIGFDLTVDEDERVWVLEWNGGHNGVTFGQLLQGPCLADLGWQDLWRG